LMQLFSSCYEKEFVVDVHAILFGLRDTRRVRNSNPQNCHAGRRELSPHRTGTCRYRAESHGTTGHSRCNFQEQEQPHCAESVSRNPRRRGQRETEAGCSTERGCCNSPIRCHRNHWSSFPFHQYVEGAKKATFRRAVRRRCERRCERARWSWDSMQLRIPS
jgi:hypothetical protein